MAQTGIAFLSRQGLRAGDLLLLSARHGWSTLCLLFAAWKLGARAALLAESLIPFPHYYSALAPALTLFEHPPLAKDLPSLDDDLSDAVSLYLLTSGSSGTPKWAAFTRRALFASSKAVAGALGAREGDRWLLSLPLFHVGGLGAALRALSTGGTLVFENKQLDRTLRLRAANARFASLVPTQLYRLLQCTQEMPDTTFLIGGARLPRSLYERAVARGLSLYITYGLTEMSSTVLLSAHPVWQEETPYLGEPLPTAALKLEQEELCVRGASRFAGYLNAPPPPPWLPTGDLAAHDPRFGYAIKGRKDFQFISGGENIQPEEIEAALLSHPDVEEAVVVPLADEEYGSKPAAWIRTTLSCEELQRHAATLLPRCKIPVLFLPLQHTADLKPNRKRLIAAANQNFP